MSSDQADTVHKAYVEVGRYNVAKANTFYFRYPLPLDKPEHALILEGFNADMVDILRTNNGLAEAVAATSGVSTGKNGVSNAVSKGPNDATLLNLTISPIKKRLKVDPSKPVQVRH